jgi:hypothetical protein
MIGVVCTGGREGRNEGGGREVGMDDGSAPTWGEGLGWCGRLVLSFEMDDGFSV